MAAQELVKFLTCGLFILVILLPQIKSAAKEDLLVLTVATEETDGYKRFIRSAVRNKYNVKVVGMGKEWKGGDLTHHAGGGHKVNLLREVMPEFKDRQDLIVMFTDSYDVVLTRSPKDVLKTFKRIGAQILFSAEGFCWPDESLKDQYPEVKLNEKRFLNSGGFIGYAPQIYELLSHQTIGDRDDDQLFYTQIFLDADLRRKWSIKLDTRGEIFQNLNGALGEVQVKFKGKKSFLYNTRTGNTPMVIHGNGPIKTEFNRLTDYLDDKWTPSFGCLFCKEDTISLKGVKDADLPTVMIAIFFDHPTPFASDFLQKVAALKYPKAKTNIFIFYNDAFHKPDVETFTAGHKDAYHSIESYSTEDQLNQWTSKNRALERCMALSCQYLLMLNGEAQITNEHLMTFLMEQNRTVVGPMLQRIGKVWSNFWGAVGKDGYYKRSDDYMEIVQRTKRGLWNIPYLTDAYLIHGSILPKLVDGYNQGDLDPDMAICKTMREKGVFMYVSNTDYHGHLTNSEHFDSSFTHPDFYQLMTNQHDWEKKYLHENYSKQLEKDFKNEEICTDVYWIPIVNDLFSKHLIDIMEAFGQWSGGRNEDQRLAGGYENVPTDDIHMNQVGLEKQWLYFLKEYVSPLATKVYPGYFSESRAIMNFVVKYHPERQKFLRPHHDSSTFTINIALNQPGVDYQGGGTRFIRYNCDVVDSRVGWMLLHPGRLTHYHEGLPITGGTRYIMISFIDP